MSLEAKNASDSSLDRDRSEISSHPSSSEVEPASNDPATQAGGAGGARLLYGLVVFGSSAILLMLEITAGRLIAPYVGVSIYSWTSIIGVILAGLSLGSWLGGVWADRSDEPSDSERAVGLALGAAGVASIGILLMLTWIAPIVLSADLSLMAGAFWLALGLFFVPSILLGTITPLLIALALRVDTRAGRTVGMMHALSALGSITGTFTAGFWLIQHIGTRAILLLCAGSLFAMALPFLLRRGRSSTLVALLLGIAFGTGWMTHDRQGFLNPCNVESQYYCIRIESADSEVPFGEARAMVLDHLVHGISHATEPGMLISPYLHLSDELILGYLGSKASDARYLFLGGGAYTHPRAVAALTPDAKITVVEIDPQVTRVAAESLYLDRSSMRIIHSDARIALQSMDDERFDVIIGDIAHDVTMPWHLMTDEYARLVKSRLTQDGLYLLNLIDAYPDPLLVKSLVNTLRPHFEHVHVWIERLPENISRETFILSATDRFEPPLTLRAQRGFERDWHRITKVLESTGTPMDRLPALSDDHAPIERLIGRLITSKIGN
ncbi:fused MFS/spermidine synthase [Thioalkalivibrio sp. HK1]|uniref:fused MFS/spermidine synthase n=1 Tax=Thioalkalivibrio sp. HK1 TaxID=1469245 RepID=UPI0012DD0BE6|nr:fused MFS/spermidine synthase [Thioalkalivibrio sp. HK1]